MDSYQFFAQQAINEYKSLTEEQNELYKRKFVSINPDAIVDVFNNYSEPDSESFLSEFARFNFEDVKIKFDAIIGGTDNVIVGNPQYLHIMKPNDIKISVLDQKLHKNSDDKIAALIHGYTKKMIFIDVPSKAKANINLLFVNAKEPVAAQVFVNTGDESELNLLEWFASGSEQRSASAIMHEGNIGKYSNVAIDAIHNEDENTTVLGLSKYRVNDSGKLKLNYFYNGGAVTRVKNHVDSCGFESESHTNELVFGSQSQKFDIYTYVVNSAQSSIAELHSKAALANTSFCILKGFAKIPFGSRNARSFVHESGMLLDKTAQIESIPAMSIDENEVKATHASATGPIDEEVLFYLTSKGLDEKRAKKLLVEGFFSSSIGRIKNDTAKIASASLIADKIETGDFGGKPKLSVGNIWITRESQEDIFKGHYKYR